MIVAINPTLRIAPISNFEKVGDNHLIRKGAIPIMDIAPQFASTLLLKAIEEKKIRGKKPAVPRTIPQLGIKKLLGLVSRRLIVLNKEKRKMIKINPRSPI